MVIDFAPPGQAVDTLRGALNEIDIGIVLLDKDLRPQFVNRAFMQMWHLTDVPAVAKLDFEGLMRLVVSRQSSPMPAAKFNEFIKKRTSLVSRFRSSLYLAAPSVANLGIKGTLAKMRF
jgi:PAS domain-containing protein